MERTVKSMIKRFASILLAIATFASVIPAALANPADQFSDFPTGWSRPAMEAAVENGLLVGIGGDRIGPKKNLTRAEMAAVMVRAFGATTIANVSRFTDLDEDSWYYDSVASAVKMGALAGISNTEMAPNDYITREQMFSILARILALDSNNTGALSKFKDGSNVSSWARSTVIPMVERGYVVGDDLGKINPQAYITREEFAQVMYTTIKKYLTESGTYEEDLEGIVVLRTGDITLDGVTVSGDLVVGDGAAKDLVVLDDVSVDGRLLTRGGTNKLIKTTVSDGVVVLNPNGTTYFNNYRIETVFDDIIEHTKAQFLTQAPGGLTEGDQIIVNFYKGYGDRNPIGSANLTLSGGVASVTSSQIPDTSAYYWNGNGFDKSDYMPDTYTIKNNEYKATPTFWYQDGGQWKPFDETVELSQDTNVYLMYREVSVSALGANIFARYDENSRVMDTIKVLAHQTYKALEKAKNENLPMYDSLSTNIQSIFAGTGLIVEENGKQYLKPYLFPLALSNALGESDVKDVVEDRIDALADDIEADDNVETLLAWPGVAGYLQDEGVATGDEAEVIAYVNGLTNRNGIYNAIYATSEYVDVIAAINAGDEGEFDVIPTNLELLKAIREELQIITFDTVMDMGSGSAITGMTSILGYDVCADIFDGGREVYCDELAALIDDVENGAPNSAIDASFTLAFDLVADILKPLYDRAEEKMVNKFRASLRYDENPYLQYLVEDQEIIDELFGYDAVPAGQERVRTGYYIKDITEYAKYMVKLLIAIDDAFSVYGDNGELGLLDAEFEALFDEVFADIYDVHDQLDAILTDFYDNGQLPDVIQTALDSVQQLNNLFVEIEPTLTSLIGAYFDTTIYEDLSGHTPGENSMKIAEILAGREDVTFTIDDMYEAIGANEEAIMTMLDGFSGSIEGIADLLKNKFGVREDMVDAIVRFVNNVANGGLRQYRVSNPAGATTVDEYKVQFSGNDIILKRALAM